ncbi:hypothetical protein [Bacillus pseudomycoides]|nr:hypothetical protein [Bacillus pseudomycoides]MED0856350.1 hypothetical protein [Bacillus pseudomycoides]
MGSRGRVPLVGADKVRGLFLCHAGHGAAPPPSVADPFHCDV